MRIIPAAEIICWDSVEVHLKCPYCTRLESQKFVGYDTQKLRAGCGDGEYLIEYPLNTWELDKINGRYVNARQSHDFNNKKEGSILERPHPFPPVSIMNGQEDPATVDRVLQIASIIHHRFSSKEAVSHPEKQLTIKFLDLHVWLPDDIAADKQLKKDYAQMNIKHWWFKSSSSVVLTLERLQDELALSQADTPNNEELINSLRQQISDLKKQPDVQKYEEQKFSLDRKRADIVHQQKLLELSKITPSNGLKKAIIRVESDDRLICEDCSVFVETINSMYGLDIKLEA